MKRLSREERIGAVVLAVVVLLLVGGVFFLRQCQQRPLDSAINVTVVHPDSVGGNFADDEYESDRSTSGRKKSGRKKGGRKGTKGRGSKKAGSRGRDAGEHAGNSYAPRDFLKDTIPNAKDR